MLYKQLTVKELYASIPATSIIESFFRTGLESESCRGIDPFLHKFGKFLFKAKGPDPFREFVESGVGKDAFQRPASKSGSEELQEFCKDTDIESVVRRFGKYLNLDDVAPNGEGS